MSSPRFESPFAVRAPDGAEGWEKLYPYHGLFSPERRASEEDRFWFMDGMHLPEPLPPFDAGVIDSCFMALGQVNSRIFCIPAALGIDHRFLNGYLYLSVNTVTDPEEIERRAALFAARAGHYYQHWDELYARWVQKVEAAIADLSNISVPDLPDVEDESVVLSGRGVGSADALLIAYNRCLEGVHRIWQYHFELLNLGYAAYLSFYQFCKDAFPDIQDQSVTKLVSGVDVLLFRPDEELKDLARAALSLGVADPLKGGGPPAEIEARLSMSEPGRQWLNRLEESKRPWFNFSHGNGFYHHHRSWIDDPTRPFATIADYIQRLERGIDISRPLSALCRERDRATAEYRALLPTDESRRVFDDTLGLSRMVFPYVENHNFYVEHWYHTVFWNKIREFGALFTRRGFFTEPDDIFLLRRYEVYDALTDLMLAWAAGSEARGPRYWPPIIAERKAIMKALRAFSPPPVLGAPPGLITEPLSIMLWGITPNQVDRWLSHASGGAPTQEIIGIAASPGIAEGPARVLRRVDELDTVEEGEILVCPCTSPSWTLLFGKLRAAVSDIGGIMCHAAIVSREYGLPAVVGTGFGTTMIKTGQRIRVDGNTGIVTILASPPREEPA